MEKRKEKKAPTTQPCETPRTCLRAAHHVGKEPKPGSRAVGVVGGESEKATCAAVPSADAKAHLQFDRASRYRHVFDASSPCCFGDVASCGAGAPRPTCDCEHPCVGVSDPASRCAAVVPRAAAVHARCSSDSCWSVSAVGVGWLRVAASLGACEGWIRLAGDLSFKGRIPKLKPKRPSARKSRDKPLRMGGLLMSQPNRLRALSQIGPVHIRPQLFASDRAGCLAVYEDADFSGNPALRVTPKPHRLGSYAHDLRELRVTTLEINRALDVIHARNSTLVEQQIYNRVRG